MKIKKELTVNVLMEMLNNFPKDSIVIMGNLYPNTPWDVPFLEIRDKNDKSLMVMTPSESIVDASKMLFDIFMEE